MSLTQHAAKGAHAHGFEKKIARTVSREAGGGRWAG